MNSKCIRQTLASLRHTTYAYTVHTLYISIYPYPVACCPSTHTHLPSITLTFTLPYPYPVLAPCCDHRMVVQWCGCKQKSSSVVALQSRYADSNIDPICIWNLDSLQIPDPISTVHPSIHHKNHRQNTDPLPKKIKVSDNSLTSDIVKRARALSQVQEAQARRGLRWWWCQLMWCMCLALPRIRIRIRQMR